jgi:hypothetical protein
MMGKFKPSPILQGLMPRVERYHNLAAAPYMGIHIWWGDYDRWWGQFHFWRTFGHDRKLRMGLTRERRKSGTAYLKRRVIFDFQAIR